MLVGDGELGHPPQQLRVEPQHLYELVDVVLELLVKAVQVGARVRIWKRLPDLPLGLLACVVGDEVGHRQGCLLVGDDELETEPLVGTLLVDVGGDLVVVHFGHLLLVFLLLGVLEGGGLCVDQYPQIVVALLLGNLNLDAVVVDSPTLVLEVVHVLGQVAGVLLLLVDLAG